MITPETTLQRQRTLQSVKALNLEVTVTKGQELDPGKLGHFRSPLHSTTTPKDSSCHAKDVHAHGSFLTSVLQNFYGNFEI